MTIAPPPLPEPDPLLLPPQLMSVMTAAQKMKTAKIDVNFLPEVTE
jgi:hypothetical protein